jgi:hypothetical protein
MRACVCTGDLVRASTDWLWGRVPFLGGYVMRSFAPCRLILEKTVAGPRPLTLLEGVGEHLLETLCVPRWSLDIVPYPTTAGVRGIQHAQEHKQTVGMVYYDLRTGKVQVCVCE